MSWLEIFILVTKGFSLPDALLEELQTSVSRPGSSLGQNGPVSGYREVTRTVTTEVPGQPPQKHSEYQIEYLRPSNTTTVLQELPPPPPPAIMVSMQVIQS